MNYFCAFCVCGILLNSIENSSQETTTTGLVWGNTSFPHMHQHQVSEPIIPLFTHSATIIYPPSLPMSIPMTTIHGIEHVNLVNKEETGCDDPIVEIHDGGLSYTNVTIHITSQRGCPLESVVNIYGLPNRNNFRL